MTSQILDGLSHLHRRDILHLDLKPDNLLFSDPTPEGIIKLVDFGWARIVRSSDEPLTRLAGTLAYAGFVFCYMFSLL